MNIKNILLFIGGLAVGGAAGVLGTRKYFQDKYQRRYEDDHAALEEYYHRTDEYARGEHENRDCCALCYYYDKGQNLCTIHNTNVKSPYTDDCLNFLKKEEEEFEDDGINSNEVDSRPGGRMSDEERDEIKKKLNKNWEGTTNYAGMYRVKNGYTEEKLAEGQHPLDQGEDGEEDPEDEVLTPEEEAFDDYQQNKNRPPKIISAEDYEELPAYVEKNVLYLYAYDEMLVDGDNEDEPIDEPERLIGDALTKYDFVDSDERLIFVMNYALNTCYEIQKVDASWSDSH